MDVPVVSSSPGEVVFDRLTDRETVVFLLVAEGLSAKQIGEKLKISHKTVEFHKRRIFGRLGIHSSLELVRYAVQAGLILSAGFLPNS